MKTPRLLYLVHVIVILYLSYFIFANWWMTLYDRQDFNCVDMIRGRSVLPRPRFRYEDHLW
jgi:hypothetical protein